jgi:predicted DNA-binding ribbon-helix-helix protein
MGSTVVKRSVIINRRKTSISLEDAFWKVIKSIAATRNMTMSGLVAEIDGQRRQGNLSSAVRLYVLDYYRDKIEAKPIGDQTKGSITKTGFASALG